MKEIVNVVPKLDSNGDMILMAIHTYDATYFIDNTIKFTNNLKICRNGSIPKKEYRTDKKPERDAF